MDGQSLSGRHIEWSHMAATHSVMRVSRHGCLSAHRGPQGHWDARENWCTGVIRVVQNKVIIFSKLALFCFL